MLIYTLDSQEDRFGLLQLSQPDLAAVLQLLLSCQLVLCAFAQRAPPPKTNPGLVTRMWNASVTALCRQLGLSSIDSGTQLAQCPRLHSRVHGCKVSIYLVNQRDLTPLDDAQFFKYTVV